VVIRAEDDAEFMRLVQCYSDAKAGGDDDLYLRQTVNDLRILLSRIQNSLGVVASEASPLDFT
jgi:hypothetical protein